MEERTLQNANIVFVGGSGGIGLASATAIASRGAAILIVGRDRARGEHAVSIVQAAGASDAAWLQADISSVSGMVRAAEEIQAWRPTLHGLVHSAMTVRHRRMATTDGLELAFALQYLARYTLNRLLIQQLAASGDGRIIHVGAQAPAKLIPDFDDLQFEKRRWSLLPALMSSQVLGYLHVQEAAKRWQRLPVTTTIACVGPTKTNNVQEQPLWVRALYNIIATTPERSARNIVRLLSAPDIHNANGTVLLNPKRFQPTPLAYDPALAMRAWEHSEQLLQKHGLLVLKPM